MPGLTRSVCVPLSRLLVQSILIALLFVTTVKAGGFHRGGPDSKTTESALTLKQTLVIGRDEIFVGMSGAEPGWSNDDYYDATSRATSSEFTESSAQMNLFAPNDAYAGEITPVCEPATWLAALCAVVSLGWSQRKRFATYFERTANAARLRVHRRNTV